MQTRFSRIAPLSTDPVPLHAVNASHRTPIYFAAAPLSAHTTIPPATLPTLALALHHPPPSPASRCFIAACTLLHRTNAAPPRAHRRPPWPTRAPRPTWCARRALHRLKSPPRTIRPPTPPLASSSCRTAGCTSPSRSDPTAFHGTPRRRPSCCWLHLHASYAQVSQ